MTELAARHAITARVTALADRLAGEWRTEKMGGEDAAGLIYMALDPDALDRAIASVVGGKAKK